MCHHCKIVFTKRRGKAGGEAGAEGGLGPPGSCFGRIVFGNLTKQEQVVTKLG